LFIAFSIWCAFILAVTICMAEMATYLPISSPFVRFAGRYVDESFGFAAGWNFFLFVKLTGKRVLRGRDK
jgi:amino acid transporter